MLTFNHVKYLLEIVNIIFIVISMLIQLDTILINC